MAETTPQNITIDGKDYALNDLTPNARQQLVNMRACDRELQHLQQQLAIVNTARAAYANALRQELEAPPVVEH